MKILQSVCVLLVTVTHKHDYVGVCLMHSWVKRFLFVVGHVQLSQMLVAVLTVQLQVDSLQCDFRFDLFFSFSFPVFVLVSF